MRQRLDAARLHRGAADPADQWDRPRCAHGAERLARDLEWGSAGSEDSSPEDDLGPPQGALPMRALAFGALLTLAGFVAPVRAAVQEPSFVQARPFVRQHLETLLAAAREANL